MVEAKYFEATFDSEEHLEFALNRFKYYFIGKRSGSLFLCDYPTPSPVVIEHLIKVYDEVE